MEILNLSYNRDEWRLFIDSSKSALKAVLLHNGNMKPSVPVGYLVNLKENYETMKFLLEKLKYNDPSRRWKICGDLKIVALLMGLQLGYVKFGCFLCKWNSCDRANHYVKKVWPKRSEWKKSEKNVLIIQD